MAFDYSAAIGATLNAPTDQENLDFLRHLHSKALIAADLSLRNGETPVVEWQYENRTVRYEVTSEFIESLERQIDRAERKVKDASGGGRNYARMTRSR